VRTLSWVIVFAGGLDPQINIGRRSSVMVLDLPV
jgi:hypothetical protein